MVEIEGCNRHLVVDIIEQSEENESDSLVLLPDEYQKAQGAYTIGKVKKGASWDGREWKEGSVIAFPRSVVREVTFNEETIYLVQDNYVICIIGDN